MATTNWKSNRTHYPMWLVVAEESLVNWLWYKTGIRSLFRRGLLNVGRESTSAESLERNLQQYVIDRARYFLPLMEQGGAQPARVLEIGPGGLLGQGLFYRALGIDYHAIDAFEGKVFSDTAFQHYNYLRDNWNRLAGAVDARLLRKEMPAPRSIPYWVCPLEKARKEDLGTFDFIFSYGVFEHLSTPKQAIESCRQLSKKGTRMVHRIDFFPHDFWSSYPNPLEFLTVPGRHYRWMYQGRGAPNRFHASEFKSYFEAAGFTVNVVAKETFPSSVLSIRPRLAPEFRELTDDDLLTSSVTFSCELR